MEYLLECFYSFKVVQKRIWKKEIVRSFYLEYLLHQLGHIKYLFALIRQFLGKNVFLSVNAGFHWTTSILFKWSATPYCFHRDITQLWHNLLATYSIIDNARSAACKLLLITYVFLLECTSDVTRRCGVW